MAYPPPTHLRHLGPVQLLTATMQALDDLNGRVSACTICPRLVEYLASVDRIKRRMYRSQEYWSRPLTGFGDPNAQLLLVGLAPAAHGGNRTGRMFTGDRSGDWVYGTLHKFGFASQPNSDNRDDGLYLTNAYITSAQRCAPPQNKPLPQELLNCRPYLLKELRLLKGIRVVVPLGKIAFDSYLSAYREMHQIHESPSKLGLKFGHGVRSILPDGTALLNSYHPSQQNTQTGRLTRDMFEGIFSTARRIVDEA